MLRRLLRLLLITLMTGHWVSAFSHINLDDIISHQLRFNFRLLVDRSWSFCYILACRILYCVWYCNKYVHVGLICSSLGVFSVIWDIWGNLNFVCEIILLFFNCLVVSTYPNSYVFYVNINSLVSSLIIVSIPRMLFYLIQCQTILGLNAKQTFKEWFGFCW